MFFRNFIKFLINKISRVIFYIIPDELKKNANYILRSKLEMNLIEETFLNFKDYINNSVIFYDIKQIREYAIRTSLQNDNDEEYYYLELGVFKGDSANFFSKFIKKLYCFDSFEGLKDDWGGTSLYKGYFNLNKKIPKLNKNCELIVGHVEDTLNNFLENNPKINFVHLDVDNYASTKFILEKLRPYFIKNAFIIFDELYNFPGWKNGEYKALKEVFKENEFEYKAFSITNNQVVIQIK
jgi:hypothetical protein